MPSDAPRQQSISFPCPSGDHEITLEASRETVVTVPATCPDCRTSLPGAYRSKIRDIVNQTRFQNASATADSRRHVTITSA